MGDEDRINDAGMLLSRGDSGMPDVEVVVGEAVVAVSAQEMLRSRISCDGRRFCFCYFSFFSLICSWISAKRHS